MCLQQRFEPAKHHHVRGTRLPHSLMITAVCWRGLINWLNWFIISLATILYRNMACVRVTVAIRTSKSDGPKSYNVWDEIRSRTEIQLDGSSVTLLDNLSTKSKATCVQSAHRSNGNILFFVDLTGISYMKQAAGRLDYTDAGRHGDGELSWLLSIFKDVHIMRT